MKNRHFCFACDLKDDKDLIEKYKAFHKEVWQEVIDSIKISGVVDMQIYLTGNRLFMIMTVDETFDFEKKARIDAQNSKVQQWEELMWKFQQALPWAKKGEKWVAMEKIFQL